MRVETRNPRSGPFLLVSYRGGPPQARDALVWQLREFIRPTSAHWRARDLSYRGLTALLSRAIAVMAWSSAAAKDTSPVWVRA